MTAATRAIKPRARKPFVSVQVINLTCKCGGICENEEGSTMIEYSHVVVWCTECGERYQVPESVFAKTEILK